MRVFRTIYLSLAAPGEVVPYARYDKLFRGVSLTDQDFHITNFPPGSSGEAALVDRFRQELSLSGRV